MVTRQVRRNRHCAQLAIGGLRAFGGQGRGKRLLDEAKSWAVDSGIRRLELAVMAHNERAIHLYGKTGFVREGTRRRALRVRPLRLPASAPPDTFPEWKTGI